MLLPTLIITQGQIKQGGRPQQQQQVRVHQATGYQYTRDEDAPGYSWKSRKGQEDMMRALELVVDREKIVGRTYGDIGL